ncbi:MAG: hypothetical protein JWO46_751 [Nocardioidaceae bacterium]|nr:hypothetical protein [Nocardioidaceae bacterium]
MTTHLVPPKDHGLTPCCGRNPFELPRRDRLTAHAEQTNCQPNSAPKLMKYGWMNLGRLTDELRDCDADLRVVFEDGREPTCIGSYRMDYADLAIGVQGARPEATDVWGYASSEHYDVGAHSVRIAEPTTVGEMVKALELTEWTTFEGYKGGQYTASYGTVLHRAEHGDPGQQLVGLRVEPKRVVLLTEPADPS